MEFVLLFRVSLTLAAFPAYRRPSGHPRCRQRLWRPGRARTCHRDTDAGLVVLINDAGFTHIVADIRADFADRLLEVPEHLNRPGAAPTSQIWASCVDITIV